MGLPVHTGLLASVSGLSLCKVSLVYPVHYCLPLGTTWFRYSMKPDSLNIPDYAFSNVFGFVYFLFYFFA